MKRSPRWFQIRHDLYQHVRARVEQRMGAESPELRKYRKSYDKDLNKAWTRSTVNDLVSAIAGADVVFLADFHALLQSQKTHMRILRRTAHRKSVVLALECIEAKYQKHIHLFLRGRISESTFLKRVRWNDNWGFPWENYRPIFWWAKQRQIPIYGINRRDKVTVKIHERDRFAAQRIASIQEMHPGMQVFVIYGDLHLSSNHLPKLTLKKGQRQLRVLQNVESVYFEALKRGDREPPEVVKMTSDCYCILNIPPWVKWQNYLLFLEKTYDESLDERLDYTDHVMGFAKVLCRELKLKVSLSGLSVYTAADPGFWEKILQTCNRKEAEWVARMIDEESNFYLPGSGLGYLSRASVNEASALAMEYILLQLSALDKNFLAMPGDFLRWVWIHGWSYFGSKVINPKRKTDTLVDIKIRLTDRSGKAAKEPLQLALSHKIFELNQASGLQSTKPTFKPRLKNSYVVAAEILGGLMGEKIYAAYSQRSLSLQSLAEWVQFPIDSQNFEEKYFKFIQILEQVPLSFISKEEKI